MSKQIATPWHRESYDHFWQESLPQLLASRLPLLSCQTQPESPQSIQATVTLSPAGSDLQLVYPGIPQPDADGIFSIDGEPRVVVPTASDEALDSAEVRCVGEQLYEYVQERLGQAPAGLAWDQSLGQSWLPLGQWIKDFLNTNSQRMDTTNWISRHTHLRRLYLLKRDQVIHPGQASRVCPFETPEGPNIGRVFTIALGAAIREGRLVIVDEQPEASLGIAASLIPFLENNDPNRLLMAANMLRQAMPPRQAEPAWVQTGNEPAGPDFWYGYNLLTAFVSWGEATSEDGIILSASAARRMDDPFPVEPGDMLSNRHGSKGVVSFILPDDQMPHLADGTPVDLAYNFVGIRTRMHIGQAREALLGRIARAEGKPALVPPFHAPSVEELQQRAVQAGLPESGMEVLTDGKAGKPLARPSAVGWVYWSRRAQLAKDKLRVSTAAGVGQTLGERECAILLEAGALQNLQEVLNTRSNRRPDAGSLAGQIAQGPVEPAGPPTPIFSSLVERLKIAGIRLELVDGHLTFRFAVPEGEALELAAAMPHPWLHECQVSFVRSSLTLGGPDPTAGSAYPDWQTMESKNELLVEEYAGLVEANSRLKRMLAGKAPERLLKEAETRLEAQLNTYFDLLLPAEALFFSEGQLFSGRAVAAPAAGLHLDQVGLPDEMCWSLFHPFVERELKGSSPATPDNPQASQALDRILSQSWVIVHRAPAMSPTSLLAFHPRRDPGRVVRLNSRVCDWLNADYDGDQVAVYLPVTPGAQAEAGELLSVAGHLKRNPLLIKTLLPSPEVIWGLGYLSLTPKGRQEIARIAGVQTLPGGDLLTQNGLVDLMTGVLKRVGIEPALQVLERLTQAGYAAVQQSGASLSPFIGRNVEHPIMPTVDDPQHWEAYSDEMAEKILSLSDYTDLEMGPQVLDARVRSWSRRSLPAIAGLRGVVTDAAGKPFVVRHGYSEGLSPDEMAACVAGARRGLAQLAQQIEQLAQGSEERGNPSSLHVLERARHARRPGVVFARAAALNEVDPLVDLESRLVVGTGV